MGYEKKDAYIALIPPYTVSLDNMVLPKKERTS